MLDRRFLRSLHRLLGKDAVLTTPAEVALYAYDSSLARGVTPDAVVLPSSTEQVAAVVTLCRQQRVPFTARGAGTNLSGGTITPKGGIVVCLARMDRIIEVDLANRCVVVEAGVVNLALQQALEPHGYLFCPDPASQKVSTIGGNIAENAGGPHCLKYGVTSNHVLGVEVVLPSGDTITLGGKACDSPGYDLLGPFIGSEGTFGIITKATLKISPIAPAVQTLVAVFDSLEKAGEATRRIIAAGILPAALEIMDRLMIWAVSQAGLVTYPQGAEAVLVVELDGAEECLDEQLAQCVALCREQGASELSTGMSAEERERLWQGRRGAAGAGGKISPAFLVNDGTVPRDKLPEVLRRTEEIARRLNVRVGSVFHAGDGNLHPNVYYNADDPDERRRAHEAAHEILVACVEAGGTISGEHGIGVEKLAAMPLLFGEAELELMRGLKAIFDPDGLCNPGKVVPEAGS